MERGERGGGGRTERHKRSRGGKEEWKQSTDLRISGFLHEVTTENIKDGQTRGEEEENVKARLGGRRRKEEIN